MISTSTVPTSTFLKNIEEAILEHEVIACPNIECNNKLVSKKKMSSDGVSFLEYQCQNESCPYHQKRKIKLELEVETPQNFLQKLSQSNLFLYVGIFLIGVFAYTGYQLYQMNNFIETELQKEPPVEDSSENKLSSNDEATLPK